MPTFSRDAMLDHANVAALLAPGRSLGFVTTRFVLAGLSPLPDRRVVRMVRLSGLGDLSTCLFRLEAA
jgi:hypothetical protein